MRLLKYLPRFRRAYRELDTLAQRERWLRAEIEAFQLERLNILWQHATAHVPYYRHLAETTGLPLRFGSLSEFRATVPLLQRATVKSQQRALLSECARRGKWVRTGGSTGTPISAYQEKEAHLESLRAQYRFHAAWGVDIFD